MALLTHLVMSGKQRAAGQQKCWISPSEVPLKFVDFSWINYSLIYRISDCTLIGTSIICVAWLSFHIIKQYFHLSSYLPQNVIAFTRDTSEKTRIDSQVI